MVGSENAELFRDLMQKSSKRVQPHLADVFELQAVQKELPVTNQHFNELFRDYLIVVLVEFIEGVQIEFKHCVLGGCRRYDFSRIEL